MIKLGIGTPAYGGNITSRQSQMWFDIGKQAVAWGDRISVEKILNIDTCGIDRARNILVAKAMQFNLDWLLMIDADTWGDGSGLLRMILAANEQNAAVVAAPVFLRGAPGDAFRLNVYRYLGQLDRYESYSSLEFDAAASTFKVDAVGAALMAINLRKIGFATFKFTDRLSEDLEFCRQVRENGGKILVDKRVETGHLVKPDFIRYSPQ